MAPASPSKRRSLHQTRADSQLLGRNWQQLRAEGAQLLSWERAYRLLGWIDGKVRRTITEKTCRAKDELQAFLALRRKAGLHLPNARFAAARKRHDASNPRGRRE